MMVYFLVGYMWLYIHRPFEVWGWMGNLHMERLYMFIMLFYWFFVCTKSWTSNRVNIGVGLLIVAVTFATLFSSCARFDSRVVEDWFKIVVFYLLLMSSIRVEKHLHIIFISFVVIMGLYELHSLREYFCGRGVSRMGIWRMVGVDLSLSDPNSFAATVNYGIPLLLPAWLLAKNKWHHRGLIALFVLAVVCILLTGSRSGFVALLFLVIACALFSKYRIKVILFLLLSLPLVWINLSVELQGRYLTLLDSSQGPANAQQSAESRKDFFVMAWGIWKENPVFGVGPACFSVASGTGMQSHSLYAQTISNLGTIGVVALLVLISCFFQNYREGRHYYRQLPRTNESKILYYLLVAVTVGLVQLLFLGLAGHNLFRFTWLWYGAFSALAVKFLRQHYTELIKE